MILAATLVKCVCACVCVREREREREDRNRLTERAFTYLRSGPILRICWEGSPAPNATITIFKMPNHWLIVLNGRIQDLAG